MARKQTKEKPVSTRIVDDVKSVRLELSPDNPQTVQDQAAKEGQSMAALGQKLVEDWVSSRQVASEPAEASTRSGTSHQGGFYAGSAVNIRQRWQDHRERLARGTHRNRHLKRAWVKHGTINSCSRS